ncbi:MAG: hypothetical protein ACLQG3_12225 [Terracidiphilus sp.]
MNFFVEDLRSAGRTANGRAIAWACVAALVIAGALAAGGQNAQRAEGNGRGATLRPSARESSSEVIREIDDPSSGDRWLLMRSDRSAGGPGRLVRIEETENRTSRESAGARPADNEPAARPAVIRAGDSVIVEEHTTVVDARLEAMALSSAAAGKEFKVRLKIGGKVIRVIAVEAGLATIVPEERTGR